MGFSHLDPGTLESAWAEELAVRRVAELATDFERLVVVSAHPDDETLGAAGLTHLAHVRGVPIEVVVVTDGEASHPDSPTTNAETLRRRRRAEVTEAISLLAPGASVRFFGVPDGRIEEHLDEVEAGVRATIDPGGAGTLVVSPWTEDGHRDHRIVGELAAAAADGAGATYRAYPIWLWHWAAPDGAPWELFESLSLDEAVRERKSAALDLHTSQTSPLSDQPGDETILHEGMLAHFRRGLEIFVRPAGSSTTRQHFDEFWETGGGDLWGFDTRWYEKRKRAILLGSLPRERYAHALELGCANGALTAELANRCDRVLGVDIAPAALEAARARLSGRETVSFLRATLPREWPEGTFDLIVLSEIGYYLSAADLRLARDRAKCALHEAGHLVACHWRHPIPDGPLDGDAVHEILGEDADLVLLARHVEEDFVLEVFGLASPASVAVAQGRMA